MRVISCQLRRFDGHLPTYNHLQIRFLRLDEDAADRWLEVLHFGWYVTSDLRISRGLRSYVCDPPVFDVFGNFTTVFGFRYTNLLSCLLINAWATPVSMLVTFFLLKARYHWTQLLGVAICIGGLVILVISDVRTGKDWGYSNKVR